MKNVICVDFNGDFNVIRKPGKCLSHIVKFVF